MPPSPVALRTARSTAWAVTSAAAAPRGRKVDAYVGLAGGRGEHGIAVADGVAGADGHGQPVVADAGQVVALFPCEPGVGGHHADGGVYRPGRRGGRRAVQQDSHRVVESAALATGAGHEAVRLCGPRCRRWH